MSFYWSDTLVFTQMPCKQVADCYFLLWSCTEPSVCIPSITLKCWPVSEVWRYSRRDHCKFTWRQNTSDSSWLKHALGDQVSSRRCWGRGGAALLDGLLGSIPHWYQDATGPHDPSRACCSVSTAFSLFLKLCFRSSGDLTSPQQLPSRLLGRRRYRRCQEAPERRRHQEGQDRQGAQARREPHLGRLCWCRAHLVVLETHREGEWRHRKGTSVECPLSQPNSCVSLARFLILGGAQGRCAQAGGQWGQRPCRGRMGPGCRSWGSVLSRAAWTWVSRRRVRNGSWVRDGGAVDEGGSHGGGLCGGTWGGGLQVGTEEVSRGERRSRGCWRVCVEVAPACTPPHQKVQKGTWLGLPSPLLAEHLYLTWKMPTPRVHMGQLRENSVRTELNWNTWWL